MSEDKLKIGDTWEVEVKTVDGRHKIFLQMEDFPLTCHQGDEIHIRENNGRYSMILIRVDKNERNH